MAWHILTPELSKVFEVKPWGRGGYHHLGSHDPQPEQTKEEDRRPENPLWTHKALSSLLVTVWPSQGGKGLARPLCGGWYPLEQNYLANIPGLPDSSHHWLLNLLRPLWNT